DGTPEGTVRLHLWTSFRKPRSLVVAGSLLFFVAEDEGLDLWASDGTEAGTRRITNLAPADPGFLLQESGGTLTFVAQDGASGRELWTS
ncbi:MAG TPA: hyalin, partial [Acidobacteria bacterium]|nr:hyalin [Acidobacteriota bacterium]